MCSLQQIPDSASVIRIETISAAARGGAAGVAFEAGAVAQQGEIAAFLAGLPFVPLGLGLGALAGGEGARLRAFLALGERQRLLLQELGRGELLLGLGFERGGARNLGARFVAGKGRHPCASPLAGDGGAAGPFARRAALGSHSSCQDREFVGARARETARD